MAGGAGLSGERSGAGTSPAPVTGAQGKKPAGFLVNNQWLGRRFPACGYYRTRQRERSSPALQTQVAQSGAAWGKSRPWGHVEPGDTSMGNRCMSAFSEWPTIRTKPTLPRSPLRLKHLRRQQPLQPAIRRNRCGATPRKVGRTTNYPIQPTVRYRNFSSTATTRSSKQSAGGESSVSVVFR
jgi:hypothetical protein